MISLVLIAVILCIIFKILNVNNYPERSMFYCASAQFLDQLLKRAPELNEPYVPTRLWGFSGHIQTIIQGVISRLHCPLVNGYRIFLRLKDGATVSYDLYHQVEAHPVEGDFTLIICPGIGNNSQSVYIRRVVYNAQIHGYRVAVLNHIGTLTTVPVTSPRIFLYGYTCDYAAMVKDIVKRYPHTKIVCIGFSMGGNIVTKYLGEPRVKPTNIVAGISVCQGYDADRAMEYLLEWKGFRRLYMYAMTENMKAIIRRWTNALFTEDTKKRLGVSERAVFQAATLKELDDVYTKRIAGFENASDFYRSMSCYHHLANIKVPTVFINALDDPIVPPPLLEIIRDAALKNNNLCYIEQKFGGHLGFYEGGLIRCNPVTWQDRIVVKISHALVAIFSVKSELSDSEDLKTVPKERTKSESEHEFDDLIMECMKKSTGRTVLPRRSTVRSFKVKLQKAQLKESPYTTDMSSHEEEDDEDSCNGLGSPWSLTPPSSPVMGGGKKNKANQLSKGSVLVQ